MVLNRKRILSFGIILLLLLAAVVVTYLIRNPQILKSRANEATLRFIGSVGGTFSPGGPTGIPTTTSETVNVRLTYTGNPEVISSLPPTAPPSSTPSPTPVGNIFTIFVATSFLDRTLVFTPISGITATLTGPAGTQTAVTASTGAATFSNLPAGNYTVSIPPNSYPSGQISGDSSVIPNVDPLGSYKFSSETVSVTINGPSAYSIPNFTPNSVTVYYIFSE